MFNYVIGLVRKNLWEEATPDEVHLFWVESQNDP